jgi:putative ABC transport system permease protein
MKNIINRWFRRSQMDKDVHDEIESHIEMRAEWNRESPEDAVREARRQFGNARSIRESIYDFNGFGWLEAVVRDWSYAIRGLQRNLALCLTAVVTVAIGVGATTSMFSIMRNLLLAPPPHVDVPDRVFRIHQIFFPRPGEPEAPGTGTAYPFYEALAANASTLEGVAAYMERDFAVGSGTDAGMTHAVLVSAGFWKTLGVRPALGRLMEDTEVHPVTGSRVVLLGHAFWRRHFNGGTAVIGQTLRIKGQPYQIIGVAPRGFRGIELADVDLWLPLFAEGDGTGRPITWHTFGASYSMNLVIRMKPGITIAQASAQLTTLQRSFLETTYMPSLRDEARMETYRRARVVLGSITGGIGENLRPIPEARVTAWLVGIAVLLVAVACLNVAGLLLLRAMQRRHEIGVRLALGISRWRLASQLFAESSVLAIAGGTAALLTVVWGGAWLQRTILPAIAWDPSTLIQPSVLLVAALSTLAASLAAGMAPLLYIWSKAISALHDRSATGLHKRPRMQSVLLAAQGALSVVLLVGAGLFLRSLHNIESLDIGLEREDVLAVQADFSGSGRDSSDVAAFFEQALERVSSVPGVTQASLALAVPLRLARGGGVIRVPGRETAITSRTGGSPFVNYVTPGFFRATGMRILQGREFLEAERNSKAVMIVNETMARMGWPGRPAVGECVYQGRQQTCVTVVGIVTDAVRFNLVEEDPHPYYYMPLTQADTGPRALLARVLPGVNGTDGAIRQALWELDPALPYLEIETLGEALDPQIRPWRLGASVFTAFGGLAMGLAMIGLWSTVSYAASQRKHEFAIRMAIGARPRSLIRLVLTDALGNALGGITAGILMAVLATRFIADLLFGVSPRDPMVFGSVALGVLIVATVASLLPAWRGSRIDPANALRGE